MPDRAHGAIAGPVLGLESSCDESAVALLSADGAILAERVASQDAHARFGGVVPEIAARAHLALLPALIHAVLGEAGVAADSLGVVASTVGPGLIGGLLVGACLGKGLAMASGARFVAVNHLEAHALTARLPALGGDAVRFPYLLLLLSGGHGQCLAVDAVGRYRRLGGTIDDAAGEAFDKVAKMLGLPWPGGPALERLARDGDAGAVRLPRPMLGRPGCDFSFSGLKTAVRQVIAGEAAGALGHVRAADIAASFQQAVADVLADRTRAALRMMAEAATATATPATAIVVAGGVAANGTIRARLAEVAAEAGLALVAPPSRFCTDNAVMVAWAAIERLRAGLVEPDELAASCRPRFPLDPGL